MKQGVTAPNGGMDMKYVEKKRWAFLGLPLTFTTYTISEEYVTVDSGFLNKKQNDCYMYKIVDTRLCRSFLERIFGLGTVHCYGGDVTDPTLTLTHIKNAQEIKNYILEASEEARLRRRSMNTQDIAGHEYIDDMEL